MTYTVEDFWECVKKVEWPSPPARVEKAWGRGPGGARGLGSWEGGFLVQMEDHRYAYLVGSCDYTGWG